VADKGKIRQVLINLLGNAVKFTQTGSVTLRVSMRAMEDDSFRLLMSVQDTGPGIDADEQHKLFQPFVQSKSGREGKGGTGLGLAISRELVRLMGGELSLESESGKGSTFHFEIPVKRGILPEFSWKSEKPSIIGIREGEEPPRVLVVDDEPNNRGWLTGLLKTVGFAVRDADNGLAGVEVWEQWRPHLVLMDMRMPLMDGVETTRRIRSLPGGRETVVFALTAGVMEDQRRAALDCGVDDFVSKPCMEDDLFQKIQKYLAIEYLLENDAPLTVVEPESCRSLPQELVKELQQAVGNGQKNYLDTLIGKVAQLDKSVASSLRQLADNYDYDALAHLLEEVRA
jgi:CheY-like chemotaxis protein/anti-sigma regulatory factor (Ser/Thr protein kinase)